MADPSPPDASPVRLRLRGALDAAMKARDRAAISVLRSTLGAIDNAEAVDPVAPTGAAGSEVIGGAVVGHGAGDVPRGVLSEADVVAIVTAEIAEQIEAADTYEAAGRPDRAEPLRAGAEVLRAVLDEPAPDTR